MKKKILALVLASTVALTLAACGGDKPASSSTPPAPASSTVEEKGTTYTTTINGSEATMTVAADQKTVKVDVKGMVVEGTCEVADGTLTLKEMTSGNEQIWKGLAANPFTLNADGTATAAGATETEKEPASAEELFAWEGYAEMIFNKDGTYNFNYKDMVKESGTWKWEHWTLTVTDANGNEMTGQVDKEDNNILKFEFVAVANDQLKVKFQAASNVWGSALGITGTYTPEGGAGATAASGVARFAGEYDLYSEGKDLYCEEFIIEEDGTVHGVVESSGLTSFEGTIAEDGTITAEVTRLGGTMTGTVTEDLQVTVHFEVRGSATDFTGGPL